MIQKEEAIERLGDEDLFWQVCEIFFGDAPKQMEILKAAIANDDINLIGRQAHTLKSASANIGADIIRDKALKIEETVKVNDLSDIHGLYEDIENEMNKVLNELKNSNRFETISE